MWEGEGLFRVVHPREWEKEVLLPHASESTHTCFYNAFFPSSSSSTSSEILAGYKDRDGIGRAEDCWNPGILESSYFFNGLLQKGQMTIEV